MILVNLLAGNEIYSNTEKLGVSVDMLSQMLNDLAGFGYVENINLPFSSNQCSTNQCKSCSFHCSSSEPAESQNGVWMLTEKGRKAAGTKGHA